MLIKYMKKIVNGIFWVMDKVWKSGYIKYYPQYLRWLGVKICGGGQTWISPTVFFDSSHYDLIKIGNNVTISFDVAILVHDYSIVHVARFCECECKSIIYRNVEIGNNVFVGARSVVLPGTIIGDNCIIGAGSVVKGKLEGNSIYSGNPCKKISQIDKFADKYNELLI